MFKHHMHNHTLIYSLIHIQNLWIINVSGKLPTYASPKPTLMLTSYLAQNVGLGEGRWAVSQKCLMIQTLYEGQIVF